MTTLAATTTNQRLLQRKTAVDLRHHDVNGDGKPDTELKQSSVSSQKVGDKTIHTEDTTSNVILRGFKSEKAALDARRRAVATEGNSRAHLLKDFNGDGKVERGIEQTTTQPLGKNAMRDRDGTYSAAYRKRRTFQIIQTNDTSAQRTNPSRPTDGRGKLDAAAQRSYKEDGRYAELTSKLAVQEGTKGPRVEAHQRQLREDLDRLGVQSPNITRLLGPTGKDKNGVDGYFGPRTAAAESLGRDLRALKDRNVNVDYDKLNKRLAEGKLDPKTVRELNLSKYLRPSTTTGGPKELTLPSGQKVRVGETPGRTSEASHRDAGAIHSALDRMFPDRQAVSRLLANRSNAEIEGIRSAYFDKHGKSLGGLLERKANGSQLKQSWAGMLNVKRDESGRADPTLATQDARAIRKALDPVWDDWQAVTRIANQRSGAHLREVEKAYARLYSGENLRQRIDSDYGNLFGTSDYVKSLYAQFDAK